MPGEALSLLMPFFGQVGFTASGPSQGSRQPHSTRLQEGRICHLSSPELEPASLLTSPLEPLESWTGPPEQPPEALLLPAPSPTLDFGLCAAPGPFCSPHLPKEAVW